jgi:hypothetical protein
MVEHDALTSVSTCLRTRLHSLGNVERHAKRSIGCALRRVSKPPRSRASARDKGTLIPDGNILPDESAVLRDQAGRLAAANTRLASCWWRHHTLWAAFFSLRCVERSGQPGQTNKPMGASSGVLRKRSTTTTDSLAEQSPEVGALQTMHLHACVGERALQRQQREGTKRGEPGNRVTRGGYQRGERFEGYFVSGDLCVAASAETRRETATNPMVGCRAQQTCRVRCGVNRRSREERQGRNMFGAWQLRAGVSLLTLSGRSVSMST